MLTKIKNSNIVDLSKMMKPAIQMQAKTYEPTISLPAIFVLWNKDEDIELLWWKKQDRNARLLVLSFFYCATTENISWIPTFEAYSQRFNESEKKMRLEEMKFVKEYRVAISKAIVEIYSSNDLPTKNNKYQNYLSMSKKKSPNVLNCK